MLIKTFNLDRNFWASLVAALWSIFQLYTGVMGELSSIPQRAVHLAFALTLLFLLRPMGRSGQSRVKGWIGALVDALFLLGGLASTLYLALCHVAIAERLGKVEPWEMWLGLVLLIALLEATRRSVGWPLPLVSLIFIAYALWGDLLPGNLGHRAYSVERVVGQLYLMTEGIFGVALGVSAGFLYLFVAFSTFLKESGGGEFFNNLALGLAGRARGGPAKIEIISSGLFGCISGSAIANVVGTGSFTIPLMKRLGYPPHFAAAVEAVSSTGGVIMPPLMGATAFIMAELLGVPYLTIARAAFIPAVLYYFSLFCMIHFRAVKLGLRGLQDEEIPPLKTTLLNLGHLMVPLVVLVYLLVRMPDSPSTVAIWGSVLIILVAALRPSTRMGFRRIWACLVETGKAALDVALTCACAGIIVGVVMLTGLGVKLAGFITHISAGSLLLVLIFTALASLVLGMGLPITPAYLILVLIVGPIINDLGIMPLATHMFMLYFGAISFITPPVALAAYAAAVIAGSNPFHTGFTASRLGIAGFLVPFAFVANPALLMVGKPGEIVAATIFTMLGVMALAAGLEGVLARPLSLMERVVFLTVAVLLILPDLKSSLAGLLLLLLVFWWHYFGGHAGRKFLPDGPEKREPPGNLKLKAGAGGE
ncbi:TRAP transporter 4TM/12TM fusion protein [Desulfofundulus luciae]|uniref:TRAP transporter 4TM/12TM fusion protein n=1 Tax=Desulfofundulus luciae TaxID=74702 RepID=A0ABU0B2R2_9FIRM|nr:TRAP transporter permease [Desulfofundulus luciae]MDQ0287014.1 TRAP transporter 4TM/12TM fusion protein [Desulfofundulus luciae]